MAYQKKKKEKKEKEKAYWFHSFGFTVSVLVNGQFLFL
jgi:hypothetical protein